MIIRIIRIIMIIRIIRIFLPLGIPVYHVLHGEVICERFIITIRIKIINPDKNILFIKIIF